MLRCLLVFGSWEAYDANCALALLADGPYAVLVDLSLVLHNNPLLSGSAAPRVKDRLMVTGELVATETALSAPPISPALASWAAPTYDEYAVLRAERAQECEELDMEKWREAVKAVHDMVGGASTTR
ncbi:hypothetical protein Rhopal_000566-T1 [Rhodotorula paludigena]|uniref:Uncharacterized protein n=1 Tax=Rhodotorula paludigena TaxID=86838 RepID=A0AAV5GDC9_9BASI|nr:hypothetical protein Rhopal_000566-T1 [Rhodotorula paludigena]